MQVSGVCVCAELKLAMRKNWIQSCPQDGCVCLWASILSSALGKSSSRCPFATDTPPTVGGFRFLFLVTLLVQASLES